MSEERTLLNKITGGHKEYLKDLTPIFAITIFLFIFSSFMGYYMGEQISPEIFEDLFSNIPDPADSTTLEIFVAILVNNTIASFLFLVSGVLIGIPPLLFIIMNGFIVGWISWTAAKEVGIGLVLLTLVPHGIIEIPAISLSAAMGVGIGYKIIHKIRKENGITSYVKDSLNLFVTRIVPLLILAAAIETVLIALVS
ncbi:hypothetical protein GF319_13485 [Candidatus Bathyarchaeota archaeon]|nr:hypothetical protein [Candidatus Bathyarchaeota archaeon]